MLHIEKTIDKTHMCKLGQLEQKARYQRIRWKLPTQTFIVLTPYWISCKVLGLQRGLMEFFYLGLEAGCHWKKLSDKLGSLQVLSAREWQARWDRV